MERFNKYLGACQGLIGTGMIAIAIFISATLESVKNETAWKWIAVVICAIVLQGLLRGFSLIIDSFELVRRWMFGEDYIEGYWIERVESKGRAVSLAILRIEWAEGGLRFGGRDYLLSTEDKNRVFKNHLAVYADRNAQMVGSSELRQGIVNYFVKFNFNPARGGAKSYTGQTLNALTTEFVEAEIQGFRFADQNQETNPLIRAHNKGYMLELVSKLGAEKMLRLVDRDGNVDSGLLIAAEQAERTHHPEAAPASEVPATDQSVQELNSS